MYSKILIITLLFAMGESFIRHREGSSCKAKGEPGVCKSLSDCPYVYRLITEEKKKPTICQYRDKLKIVCCPIQERNSDATTEARRPFSDTTTTTTSSPSTTTTWSPRRKHGRRRIVWA